MKVGQAVAPSHNSARAATGSSPGQSRQLQSLLNVFLFKNVFVITHKQNIKQALLLCHLRSTCKHTEGTLLGCGFRSPSQGFFGRLEQAERVLVSLETDRCGGKSRAPDSSARLKFHCLHACFQSPAWKRTGGRERTRALATSASSSSVGSKQRRK